MKCHIPIPYPSPSHPIAITVISGFIILTPVAKGRVLP